MTEHENHLDERPPIMGTWRRLYIVVLLIHAALIALFWLFMWYFEKNGA